MYGTVKFYNSMKNYGFIEPDGGGEDLFVHHSDMECNTLEEGDRVKFEISEGKKGPRAISIEKVDKAKEERDKKKEERDKKRKRAEGLKKAMNYERAAELFEEIEMWEKARECRMKKKESEISTDGEKNKIDESETVREKKKEDRREKEKTPGVNKTRKKETSEVKKQEIYTSKTKIESKISKLKEEEQMINVRAIEDELKENEIQKAGKLLSELEEKYEEYKETMQRLKEIDGKLSDLSEKLADGKIDNDAFKSAKEGLETKKYDLEERLNKLRKEVIHEDYEKPF